MSKLGKLALIAFVCFVLAPVMAHSVMAATAPVRRQHWCSSAVESSFMRDANINNIHRKSLSGLGGLCFLWHRWKGISLLFHKD